MEAIVRQLKNKKMVCLVSRMDELLYEQERRSCSDELY